MSTRQLYNFVIDATLTTPALVEAKLASLEANAGEEGEGEREEDAVFMQTWTPSSLSEVANCEGDQKMRAAGQREGAYSDAVAHLLGTKKESQEDNEDGASDEEEEEEEEEKSKEGSAGGAPNGKAVRNRKGSGPANQIKRGTGKGVRGESAAGSSKPKPRPILLARPPEETKPKAEGESNESGSGKDDEDDDGDDDNSESDEDGADDENPRSAGWEWDGHAEGRLPPAGSDARDFAKSAKKVRLMGFVFALFSIFLKHFIVLFGKFLMPFLFLHSRMSQTLSLHSIY